MLGAAGRPLSFSLEFAFESEIEHRCCASIVRHTHTHHTAVLVPNDLTSTSPISLQPPTASSRTWTSAFAGRGRATDAPQGTTLFSSAASLARELLVTASGTRAAARDGKVVHVLRLLPCPREELEEWERLMREARRREMEGREKEE